MVKAYSKTYARTGTASFRVEDSTYVSHIYLTKETGEKSSVFEADEPIAVVVELYESGHDEIVLGLGIRDSDGHQVLHFCNRNEAVRFGANVRRISATFRNLLNSGEYFLTVWVGDARMQTLQYLHNCLSFTSDTSNFGTILCNGAVFLRPRWMI
jgi:hypothetical protein